MKEKSSHVDDEIVELEEILDDIPASVSPKMIKVKDDISGRSKTFNNKDEFEAAYGIDF
jgi:hypothetical protein